MELTISNLNDDCNGLITRLSALESIISNINAMIDIYTVMNAEDVIELLNTAKEANVKYMELVKNTIELFKNKYLKDVNIGAIGGKSNE